MNKTIQALMLSSFVAGSAQAEVVPLGGLPPTRGSMLAYHDLLRETSSQYANLVDLQERHNAAASSIPQLETLREGLRDLEAIEGILPDIDYDAAMNSLFEAEPQTELERLIDGEVEEVPIEFNFETTDSSQLKYQLAALESAVGGDFLNCATQDVNWQNYQDTKKEVVEYKAELISQGLFEATGETQVLEAAFFNTGKQFETAHYSNPTDCSHYKPEVGAVQEDRVLPSEIHDFDYTGTLLSEENLSPLDHQIERLRIRVEARHEAEAEADANKPSVCQYVDQGFVPREDFNHKTRCGSTFLHDGKFKDTEFEVFYDRNAGDGVNSLLHCDSYVKLKVDHIGWIQENGVGYPGGKDICAEGPQ